MGTEDVQSRGRAERDTTEQRSVVPDADYFTSTIAEANAPT